MLGELIPARAGSSGCNLDAGVVLGAGVNISMTEAELPVPTATSLALAGAHVDRGFSRQEMELDDEIGSAIEPPRESFGSDNRTTARRPPEKVAVGSLGVLHDHPVEARLAVSAIAAA